MAITECNNGHIYDSDQFPSCPYCNGENTVIRFDSRSTPVGPGKTVAPEAYSPRPSAVTSETSAPTEPRKTVAPEGYRKKQDEQRKTVAVFKKKYNFEPVVGWLTCIKGSEKGKAYHLWAKINTIGRSENMDVCILSDPTISMDTHARLAYDPKHNNFQLIPGMSVNNIYLNDEPIYIPTKLAAYDLIEMGDTTLIFVPLCGDRFKWDVEKP